MTDVPIFMVSGLRASAREFVCNTLAGGGARHVNLVPSTTFDPCALTTRLAEDLCALDHSERRHLACGHNGARPATDIVINVNPHLSTADAASTLEQVFARNAATGPKPYLRDVITVASAAEIRRLLFAAPTSITDLDQAELLAEQLEFASIILVSGLETLGTQPARETVALLGALNPRARVIPSPLLTALLQTPWWAEPRQAGRLHDTMGWVLACETGADTATAEAMPTVVFQDPRPFHPWRLAHAIASDLAPAQAGTILRSRGVIRLASRPASVLSWTSTGQGHTLTATDLPSWNPRTPGGQQVVFVGVDLHDAHISSVLAGCLLTDAELLAGPMEWAGYADPFPT
ncbi:MAG: GTP-binding protein [Cryobacterium sp.]